MTTKNLYSTTLNPKIPEITKHMKLTN